MKYTFPATYGDETYLVPVDAALVPLISGALNKFQLSSVWENPEDYQQGYRAFAELQANLMGTSLRELVEGQNRLYRLLDTALNGTQYTSSPDPNNPAWPLVEPAIPAAPAAAPTNDPTSLRAQLARLHQLAENAATGAAYGADSAMGGTVGLDYDGSWRARLEALQGEINEGWFGIGGQSATIADLVAALRIGNPQDSATIDTALEALQAASSSSVIFDTVRGLLGDVVDTGIEGGVLAVLIASSIANAGMLGALAGQLDQLTQRLDRVAAALDGGTVPAPSNVITELEAIKTMVS